MKKFNELLAEKITIGFYSMWAFYVFFLYGLIPVWFPASQDKVLYYSNFIQLISLPAIGVGAVVLAKKQDKANKEIYEAQEKRAQETHDTVMEELNELRFIHSTMLEELVEIRKQNGGTEHDK